MHYQTSQAQPEEWAWSDYGRDRLYGARLWFGEEKLTRLEQRFPPGAEVALVVSGDAWSYYFLLRGPQTHFTLLRPAFSRRADPDFGLESIWRSSQPRFDQVVCLTDEREVCREGSAMARRPAE